jgi:hypothetical protein
VTSVIRARIVKVMCPWRSRETLAEASSALKAGDASATQILATSKKPNIPLIMRKRIELDGS